MPNVNGGALEGYADGCTATFNKQYAVIRGNWNVAKSYSTGEKNQEFACRYALIPRTDEKGKARDAVVKGSVKVYVGDELWSPVDNIKSARPGDKVYQLDMTTGFFTFGDGEHGVIPEKGKQIKVDYYSSGTDSLGPTQQAVIQAVAQDNLDNQKDGTGEFKFFSTPSAHIFQMLNGSFGSKMVGTSLSNEGTLSNGVSQHSVMASTDENGTVYIAIVNLGLNDVETAGTDAALSQKVTLAVNGMDLTGKTLKIKTLAGDSFYQENDLANPENVAIEERTEEATGATYELELAPHSFTIVAIGDGSEEPPVDPDPEPEPEPTVYTIKLMLDGEPYKTIDVADGKLSEELSVLTREGWVFEGWFYEDGTEFDPSRPIEGDLVLSAKWTKASTPDEPSEKPTDPKPTPKPERKPQGGLPQTGDASTLMVAGGVAVGVATTIAGARARKRRV